MKSRGAGFTLLEMLAALVLLAILLTVAFSTFAQVNRSLAQIRDSDRLSQAARSLLDEQHDRRLQVGLSSGVLEGGIAWRERVTALPTAQGQLALFRIQLQLDLPGATPWTLETLVAQVPALARSTP